jgi:hypothetical protein
MNTAEHSVSGKSINDLFFKAVQFVPDLNTRQMLRKQTRMRASPQIQHESH